MIRPQYIILVLLMAVLGLNFSCDDSLGVEKQYRRELLSDTSKPVPPEPKNVRFKCDSSMITNPVEELTDSTRRIHNISWISKYSLDAQVDTSDSKITVWILFDIENKNDSIIPWNAEHVKAIRLRLDSVPAITGETHKLTSDVNGGKWSLLLIEQLPNNPYLVSYTGATSQVEIEFDNIYFYKGKGTIRARVNMSCPAKSNPWLSIKYTNDIEMYFSSQ